MLSSAVCSRCCLRLLPAIFVLLALVATSLPAAAQPTLFTAVQPRLQDACVPTDPALAELSGLASDGQRWFAVGDGGTRLQVLVLDPADCTVLDEISAAVDPYDVEDLALAPDGALWLPDTGDNGLDRRTVALHRLDPEGDVRLYRLTYPDGPHDVEALVLDREGIPHLVTKELGPARVYRPVGVLAEPGPTLLEQVATVRIKPTSTPGGPAGSAGSVLVTGGAVSVDGRVVALRTYTDAYLFSAPDGDVVAALGVAPVRIPLAGEPQGEAVALAPDGTLLSGSEMLAGSTGLSGVESHAENRVPIRALPRATALVTGLTPGSDGGAPGPPDDMPSDTASSDTASSDTASSDTASSDTALSGSGEAMAEDALPRWQVALVTGGLVGVGVLAALRRWHSP